MWLLAVVSLGWAQSPGTPGAYPPVPWDVCVENQGKGGTCGAGAAPLPFSAWLKPSTWLRQKVDGFRYEMEFDVSQAPRAPRRVTWKPVGQLAGRRIRRLDHYLGVGVSASMLLAERTAGQWVPLLQWYGEMPEASLLQAQGKPLLLVEKDWGVRVPMVESWVWVDGPDGVVRVDGEGPMDAAMAKVGAAGYKRLSGLYWRELKMNLAVWQGDFPGMDALTESVEAWFQWEGAQLRVKAVERSRRVAAWPQ
ncbi:MAG: hypothetical protein JNK87_36845 [Bryobacterales bacterium]|nr:hypothetical protein [Bryobacterales bacterium]